MPTVTWARFATHHPMGQQAYESQIEAALVDLDPPGWSFRDLPLTSLRAQAQDGTQRRYPARLLAQAPLPVARGLGALTYGRGQLVHRLDLRLPPAAGAEVVTVHDLPPLRYRDEGTLPGSAAAGARRAREVICPSEFAARECRELLGVRRITVIPYGLSGVFRAPEPATQELLTSLGVRRPFVLHAAGATDRKNLRSLAGAWDIVAGHHPDLQLVLCGPPDVRREALFPVSHRTVLPGRVPPDLVASLMTVADAVVVPSEYEGFGLPAIEAMACGAPVVAADAGALPEVCGDAALMVQPTAEGIAEGLDALLTDGPLADRLRSAGRERATRFDWRSAAQAHLEVYRRALGG